MIKKIYLMINLSLFPFKDLTFYNNYIIQNACKHINNSKDKKYKINTNLLGIVHQNTLKKCDPKSVDEINLVLRKYYPFLFHKTLEPENIEKQLYDHYFENFESFAKSLLSHRDGQIVYKYWKNEKDDEFLGPYSELDKVEIFSAISRFIPIDILIASYYSINKIKDTMQLNGFYQHINLADAPLHDILVNGVSENHIHATSSFNFSTLWEFAMNGSLNDSYLENFKTNHYATSEKIKEYLLTARIMRLIMAKFLSEDTKDGIYDWIYGYLSDDSNSRRGSFGSKHEMLDMFFQIEGREFLDEHVLKELWDRLKMDFGIDEIDREKDIVFSIFKQDDHINTYGENIFLQHAFMYKDDASKRMSCKNVNYSDYTEFCNMFFKYISIKNEFYQQITQSSTIKGLDFFVEHFARGSRSINLKGERYYGDMLRTLFQNEYLKKVELRISIMDEEDRNRGIIRDILTAYRNILREDYGIEENQDVDFPRIGIIYHLIKRSDDIEKCWCMYDEESSHNKDKLYYKDIQNQYFKLIKYIMDMRNRIPYLANFIVGIDAASLENNTPVQVFAPVFEKARNSDFDPLLVRDSNGRLIKNQSLFFTFHAGEDFRHINSGLRRIDEVIEHCKFHSGDRIGHGIALGMDIEKWTNDNPVTIIPRGEYLDNLLWIWGVYSKFSNISPKAYIYLEQKIYKTAKDIFENTSGLTPAILYDAYKRRFKVLNLNDEYRESNSDGAFIGNDKEETLLHIYKFCKMGSEKYAFHWDSEKLHHAYHCKCYLEKIIEPIYINTCDIEKEMSLEMQQYLIGKVAKNGIVIEANPTSNCAIGEIDSIYDNQFFSVNSENADAMSVLVNVNSDNPMIFNTNVSNEISYLYYGMLKRGVAKESALKWIEKIRKTGVDTSFIRTKMSNRDYINALDNLLLEFDNRDNLK